MMQFPPLPPALVRRFAYPLSRRLRGDRVLDALAGLERDQWLSRAQIEELQWRRLKDLLSRIVDRVPYYRDLFARLGVRAGDIRSPEDFRRLPVLTREIVRAERERLVTGDPRVKGEPSSTGGSTGEPLYFSIDRASGPLRRANGFRVARWLGLDIGDRQAVLWGIHIGRSLGERIADGVRNYFGNTMYLSSFGMSEPTMEDYAGRLRRYRPALVVGYPSALARFAEHLKRSGAAPIRPKAVVTSGERLWPAQRGVIEEAFGANVFDRYGCREFSGIAQQCGERGGLHLFADLLYVEVIHESGRPARDGEAGEVVVTDPFNLYMPFVRYRTGDLAVASDRPCPCGRGLPLIESVEGRSFDVVVTPDGTSVGGFFWTWLSRSVPGIGGFQIEQRSRDGVIFRIVRGPDWRDEFSARLESSIRENCGADFSVAFEFVDEIPLTRAGKFRFIISNIE